MIDLGKIPEEQKTPLVMELLHIIQQLTEQIEQLREEVARLKEHKGKPKIPPSQLEKDPKDKQKKSSRKKRPGSAKRDKTKQLTIHETISVPTKEIPPGSKRAGYNDCIVQGLKIELNNVCYRLECWITTDGKMIKGELPDSVDGHFEAMLPSFILQQYNHGHVTQPLIWEELVDFGVDISKGQVSRILTEQKEDFHIEKEGVLCAGLDISSYINVDDTAARHAGKNGYCTHIGNELFAWFESTASKSRMSPCTTISVKATSANTSKNARSAAVHAPMPEDAAATPLPASRKPVANWVYPSGTISTTVSQKPAKSHPCQTSFGPEHDQLELRTL